MKKTVLFFALLLAFSAALIANEQRLVGTWVSLHTGLPVTFNGDGTVVGWPGTVFYWQRRHPTHWAAGDNTLILFFPGTDIHDARMSLSFSFSSDGRTLIIGSRAFRRN